VLAPCLVAVCTTINFVDRFVYEDNALMVVAQLHQLMEAGVNLDHTVHAAELVVVELDTGKENATTLRK